MRKRVILPAAVRTIRELKAKTEPNFTAGHFGPRCLISSAHLINVEKGRKTASAELIERIAAQLDVPIEAISYEAPEAISA